MPQPQHGQSRGHVLLDGARVAGRRVGPEDAALAAIGRVDVVVAYGGGEDAADFRAVEKRRVATRAGPGDYGVGILNVGAADAFTLFIYDFRHGLERTAKKGYLVVGYDFHISGFMFFANLLANRGRRRCARRRSGNAYRPAWR